MLRNFAILALVASCLSAFVEAEVANEQFLKHQKIVLDLFWHLGQPEIVPDLYTLGKSYDIKAHLDSYKNQDSVNEFLYHYKQGLLPRGEIFSIFYPEHIEQAARLFKVFYYANNFDTLYKTAAWARIYVNQGLFIYSFSVAVLHHHETKNFRIPPLHELYPNLYFDNEVILKALDAKNYFNPAHLSADGSIIINSNYSKYYSKYHLGDEYKIAYYTEDIAVNDLNYFIHLYLPFWMSSKEFGLKFPIRGELYFWIIRLQFARYQLERFSNDLGIIEDFDWSYPIPLGYKPTTSYHNGLWLPRREPHSFVPSHNYGYLKEARESQDRISWSIDMGQIVKPGGKFEPICELEGLEVLGNVIEGNADSVNRKLYGSFEILARHALGFSPPFHSKYGVVPSALLQYGVDQRDPMYWSLMKKIVGLYEQYVSKQPKYTKQQLEFPGVSIESVVVDKVTTFYEYADYLVSGAVNVRNHEDKTLIKARQYRLNHKPFTYTITINSDKAGPASIRIFLGPKYNEHHQEIDISENWRTFLFLDEWKVDLKVGVNKFERSSKQSIVAIPEDPVSGDVFYNQITKAIEGTAAYDIPKRLFGYPERLIVPKGKYEGQSFQFFVYVSEHTGAEFDYSEFPKLGHLTRSSYGFGFPLDRPVYSNFTELPNAYFKEFKIYHVEKSEINVTV